MDRRTAARAAACQAALRPLLLVAALVGGCDALPDLAVTHLGRGDRALVEGRYGEALAAYAHAHELAPRDPRVQRAQMRARVTLMAESPARVAADALEDVAYEAEVLRRTEKGLEAVCLAALGNVLARRGDMEGARAKLVEAVKVDPNVFAAQAALGAFLLDRPEAAAEAKAALEHALVLRPGAAGPLAGLGKRKLAEGDLPGAIERLVAALKAGDDFGTRLALGNARLQQGNHVEAAADLERAVQMSPRSPEALSLLGQALLGAARLDEAERALRASVELRPDAATSIALGFTLVRRKKSSEALDVLGGVLAADPLAAPALLGVGMANEDLGRAEQALAAYRRLLVLPLEGPQRQLVADLQREAKVHVEALELSQAKAAEAAPEKPPQAKR
ncbi:tetratricopeptide repeat protein [Polyangium mundeleinium]|uniref:Tetratricopeptide repeat protein n=1 Tax=Polyangium mundeleinium TaxID=2995306 RepID=A0ABT5EIY1_9BACT|nr:tetratricopeptide repeat protein [Polyangium mundeleinium]MDC0741773.1 tetratricopeptide repeat protein [Polyangium mundeleinium]